MNKKCSTCQTYKSLEYFPKNRCSKDGYSNYCLDCKKKYYYKNQEQNLKARRDYYRNNKKEEREKHNKWMDAPHGRFMYYKNRAYRRNLEWGFTESDFLKLPLICYYTLLPLTWEQKHWNTISLDRIDNNKGYTKENVVPCCSSVNCLRHTLTQENFIALCKLISKNFNDKEYIVKFDDSNFEIFKNRIKNVAVY